MTQKSAAPWAGPAQAEKGDAEVVLDDHSTYSIHSALLTLESSVLEDVLQLAHKGGTRIHIPLMLTSAEEMHELLGLLYSKRRESYLLGLTQGQLLLLLCVCDRFRMEDLMKMIDQALASHTGEFRPDDVSKQAALVQHLTPANASELYWEARSKKLEKFQMSCAAYIGAHVKEVAEAAPTDPLGPILNKVVDTYLKPTMREFENMVLEIMRMLSVQEQGNYGNNHQGKLLQLLAKVRASFK